MRNNFWLLLGTLALVGCDKEKIPLTGDRSSLLFVTPIQTSDSSLQKTPIHLKHEVHSLEFSQVGENQGHVLSHHALSRNLKLLFKSVVGQSTTCTYIPQIIGIKDMVYGIDAEGVVFAVSSLTGESLWTYNTSFEESAIGGGVACDQNFIYATNALGDVVCLNRKIGSLVWKVKLSIPIRSAPTLSGNRLYIVTIDNQLFVLDTKDGKKIWSHSGISEQVSFIGSAKPAVSSTGDVLVPYSSGEIYYLKGDNGFSLWSDVLSSPLRVDSIASISHIRARPVIIDNLAIVMSHGGRLVAFDLKTGTRQWEQQIAGIRTPVVHEGWIFVVSQQNEILCLQKDTGKIRWVLGLPQLEEGPILWAGPILAGGHLILTGSHGKLVFVDPTKGSIVKELAYEGHSFSAPIVMDTKLYLMTNQSVLYGWGNSDVPIF